jgi:hypothetical protein
MHKENISHTLHIMQVFVEVLPKKPYCTNQLGHLLIRPKDMALKHAYIQFNPIHRTYWLVFDIDYPQRRYWYDEWDLPTPNIEVVNPKNDHQHLFYLLDPAVFTLRQARQDILKLAADVDRGLTELLDADRGYGKLIAKNPFSDCWFVEVWNEKEWCLTELIQWIPKKLLKQKRKPKEEIGLGRNCIVFEKTRLFAYSEWRRLKFNDDVRLFENVYAKALDFNNDFIIPMQLQEVKSITRSVCKWTAKHHTEADFSYIQKERNLISQDVRKAKSDKRAKEIIAYKDLHPEMSIREIANILGISKSSVHRYLL